MDDLNFEDAVAVVTGAGGGIGRSVARSLASRGARVAVVDIEQDAARQVVEEIEAAGGRALAASVDVSDSDAMLALAERTASALGPVDVLVNNAGVTLRPFRAVWDASLEDFEWTMRVNYFGVVHGLRAYLPQMLETSGRKHIVNTSSMATLAVSQGNAMYTASKAAVDGLSDVLRDELRHTGHDIGLTVLYPGRVTTRISTSERLRPPTERSDRRPVREYERPAMTDEHHVFVEADKVGELVVEAIDRRLPYVTTHPIPRAASERRLEALVDGFVGDRK